MASHLSKVDVENPNLLPELYEFNLIGRLKDKNELGRFYLVDRVTKLIRPIIEPGTDSNTPWAHIYQDPARACNHWQMIERVLGFIPTPCLKCYKVVVRPRTVYELFQIYNMQIDMTKEIDNVYCKCGIEIERPFVTALYGGYFYTNSLRAGMERKAQVRKWVDKYIPPVFDDDGECIVPPVDVILKRYCTEFENRYGNSKGYNQPREAKQWETEIERCFEKPKRVKEQPAMIIKDVHQRWVEFAEQHSDLTGRKLNNNQPLYTQVQTY